MNKTALITGASGGIGKELSLLFAKDGFNLFLVSRDERKLQRIKENFEEEFNIRVGYFALDLANSDSAIVLANELKQHGVQIDILVNNAGYGLYGEFIETDMEKEVKMIQMNITTLMELTKLLLPGMRDRKDGKIINLASVAGFIPGPYMAVYYATKAFVVSLSEALSEELKDTRITVTAICPGATATDFQKTAKIENDGVFKEGKTMSAMEVAKIGYKDAMKGKVLSIPGFKNKANIFGTRFVSRSFVRKVVGKLQK